MPAPRSRVTCRQASENRSCHSRRRGCDTGGSSGPDGSSSAHTTTTGRSRSQPKPAACSSTYAGSPARPRKTSRRKSPRYLSSTAATACSRVITSAATVAARSSACTSSGPTGAAAAHTSRARSAPPATIRSTRSSPVPSGIPAAVARSTRSRPVGSTRPAVPSAARRSGDIPPAARSRPSVEVTRMPTPSTPATSAAIRSRSPPSRTDWVRAVCSASTRASAAAASSLVNNCASPGGSLAGDHIAHRSHR